MELKYEIRPKTLYNWLKMPELIRKIINQFESKSDQLNKSKTHTRT